MSELGRRRADLAAWEIDASGMSALEAWDRWGAESNVRMEARREQERRDRLENERLAAEQAKADAERERVAAARDLEAQKSQAAAMQAGQQMMHEQNNMLKGLGVNLEGSSTVHEDCEEEDYMADELNMYQAMVDNGAAPGCDGLTCGELIDCVDEALEAEEE